jgi:putative ABC transport system permease protein
VLAVTFADVWYRARQFAIAVIGVGLVLGLALSLSGMADGFYSEVADTVGGVGATSWIMSPAAQGRVTAFVPFPEAATAAVAHEPGVRAAAPILFAPAQNVRVGTRGAVQTVNLVGVQPGHLGDPVVTVGHRLTGPDQAVVDTALGAPPGAVLVVDGRTYRVVGTVDNRTLTGGSPLVYMPLGTVLGAVTGGKPLVSAVVTVGTPRHVPRGLVALPASTVVTDTVSQMQTGVQSIDNTRWLMWIVAAAIVASMLYVAALERKRDFAVLKALGSSSRTLFLSLLLEAVTVTLLAALLAEAMATLLTPMFDQPVDITPDARLALPLVAVVVGVVASVAALRRVVGADPAAAFA